MNLYFVIAGGIGLVGGFAHAFLGHKWTVKAIDTSALKSTRNSRDQDKRFLIWFWHIGSVLLLSTTALILVQGLDLIAVHRDLLVFISFIWLSITAVFIIVAGRPPVQIFKMIPGLVGIPVNLFILLGLFST